MSSDSDSEDWEDVPWGDGPIPALARGINIEQALKFLRDWARKITSFCDFEPKYSLHLRMKPQEKNRLSRELTVWKRRLEGQGRRVDEELVVQVALLLFLRWSWASDTLRAVLTTLSAMSDHPQISQGRHMETLGRTLACRGPTGQLPFDVRKDRVKALFADPSNLRFWTIMKGTPNVLWESLREIAVVPHEDDWDIWLDLARVVIRRHAFLAPWFGLSEAAVHAHENMPGSNPVARKENIKDEVDVWNVWILAHILERRRVIEDDFMIEAETREVLDRLGTDLNAYQYRVECVSYYTHEITNIKDKTLRNAILASAGLGGPLKGMEDWDLVILHHQPPGEHNRGFYATEDVAHRWDGRPLPGQYAICDCEQKTDWKGRPLNRGGWCWNSRVCFGKHPGLVYSRRKLDDTKMWKTMRHFWSTWNDCLLVRGSSLGRFNKLIDPDTIYLLESLPGVKARLLREHPCKEIDDTWKEGIRKTNLFFNLRLSKFPFQPGRNWFDRSHAHPALDDFISSIPQREFDFGSAGILANNPRGTTLLVPWARSCRFDQYGDITRFEDNAIVKIVGQAWYKSNEPDLAQKSLHKLAYLSKNAVTGKCIENVVQLVGITRISVAAIRLHNHPDISNQLSYPQCADEVQEQIDNRHGQLKRVFGLVFELAHGGQLLHTVKKHFDPRNHANGFKSGRFSETLALENWNTILRFMYELGTALQSLPTPHRALTRSNVLLRHRPFPPEVFQRISQEMHLLDRFQVALADPCPPEEVYDFGMWDVVDYPRPMGDPNCERGEDAMRFGYFAQQLIKAAMPGLEDIRNFPRKKKHRDMSPPGLLFVEVIKYVDLLGRAKATRNNSMAIKTMHNMVSFLKRIVIDKGVQLHFNHQVADSAHGYKHRWCEKTLSEINPQGKRLALFCLALYPDEGDFNFFPWDDDRPGGDDSDSGNGSPEDKRSGGFDGDGNPGGEYSGGSAKALKRGSGSDSDEAGGGCSCPSASTSLSPENPQEKDEDMDEEADEYEQNNFMYSDDESDEPDLDFPLANDWEDRAEAM